jgi:hypothetical protein
VTKFLNDYITLSEFDRKSYQGHIDVKTHYNNFKNDVIFTFVKDIPNKFSLDTKNIEKLKEFVRLMWGAGKYDYVCIGKPNIDDETGNGSMEIIYGTDKYLYKNTEGLDMFVSYTNN